ncbi:hypothetical protein F2Q68_00023697 [Brassica cretica]|uniref:Reverse transcriptase zinc-binding domain-containing protein n=1 Tax=Brassica cretica TaxID=69181 RepID=A0A8S9IAY6_BRACR|nr:hypothetical protein F2Q68_00023697 [Brassica cretica]
MSCGSLPFRYLGVPLNSRKLSLSNCNVLLQQMKSKFSSWSIKTLSFSGRLLLIKTVISGITTFCKSFLGYCDANKKDQGGLGVKDLYTWNKACSLRLVWLLFFRPDSVWVSWFKEVILKGSIQNYWTTKPKSSYSWLVNKLLKLKSVAYPLIILRVQNGRTGRFWTDNWSPYGCLETFLDAGTTRLGIPTSATIASLYRNGSWRIPSARSDSQLQLLLCRVLFGVVIPWLGPFSGIGGFLSIAWPAFDSGDLPFLPVELLALGSVIFTFLSGEDGGFISGSSRSLLLCFRSLSVSVELRLRF